MIIEVSNVRLKINGVVEQITFESYRQFVDFDKEYFDIKVEVIVVSKEKIFELYDKYFVNISQCDYTYLCTSFNGINALIFGRKGEKIKREKKDELWFLEYDDAYKNCKLFTSECENLGTELFIRPWIQRLVSVYLGLRNMFVLHGGAAEVEGEGILLLGNSGAGKSTACKILKDNNCKLLADDRLILQIFEDKIRCFSTPWNFKNPEMINNTYTDIKKIFFLNHSKNNYVEKIFEKNVFVNLFSRQIMCVDAYPSNSIITWKIKVSENVYKKVPTYKLYFLPDEKFIEYI